MAEEYLDKRLVCTHCGERGKLLVRTGGRACVKYEDGEGDICCRTAFCPTQGEAISAWQELWREPEDTAADIPVVRSEEPGGAT